MKEFEMRVMTAVEWTISCDVQRITWDIDGGWHYALRALSWNTTYSDDSRIVAPTDTVLIDVYAKTLMFPLIERLYLDEKMQKEESVLGYQYFSGGSGCVVMSHQRQWTGISVVLGVDNDSPFETLASKVLITPNLSLNLRLRFDILKSGGNNLPQSLGMEYYEEGSEAYASMPPTFWIEKKDC
jgi:hypothetical protein